jgi:superfamily I DNA/RNA helicase
MYAAFLLEDKAVYAKEGKEKLRFSIKSGFDPQLIECSDLQAQIDYVVNTVKQIRDHGLANNNVLILYRFKSLRGFKVVDSLLQALQRAGIAHEHISEDQHTKSSFSWADN